MVFKRNLAKITVSKKSLKLLKSFYLLLLLLLLFVVAVAAAAVEHIFVGTKTIVIFIEVVTILFDINKAVWHCN